MNADAIDLPEFLERVQDDKEFLLELLDIYLKDYEKKRKALNEVIAKKDYEELRGIAHSLKGASGNISAKPIRAIFLKLEEMGKNGDATGAQQVLDDLDKSFKQLSLRIMELRKELRS